MWEPLLVVVSVVLGGQNSGAGAGFRYLVGLGGQNSEEEGCLHFEAQDSGLQVDPHYLGWEEEVAGVRGVVEYPHSHSQGPDKLCLICDDGSCRCTQQQSVIMCGI